MKYIKQFRLFETDEWNRDINWNYVKENPDDDSEEALWIKLLDDILNNIIINLNDPETFEIVDIRSYDLDIGPYAIVKIFGKIYKIWNIQEQDLWIDNFPINNSEPDENPGLKGYWSDISDILNKIIESGGIEVYMNAKKYNL
jgi:hypothetical protein